MRVSLICHLFLCTNLCYSITAQAGIKENFNSRKGIPVREIKTSLQSSCWTFHHFDVNINGWNPGIEGDGAMVADAGALEFGKTGIYTPLLNIQQDLDVSFEYTFNENFSENSSRWIRICLANASNEIVQELETIRLIGSNAIKNKKYNTRFNNVTPGVFRLVLLYGGRGEKASIAIDELNTSAQFKYEGGCNSAPIAVKDYITGSGNRTASGSLITNDRDNNRELLKAYLVKNSADGKVELNDDGTFTFTPAVNFKGTSTSFIYRICDDGAISLCSPNTTVYIHFPSGRLTEFKGSYKKNGNVELVWNTDDASMFDKFELERSLDGKSWENSGTVFTKNSEYKSNDYTYLDNVGRNTALKKDLYYRLRQVKTDGTISMSRLLVVRVYNTKRVSMISVTPNPLKSDIAVNVQLQENSFVSMRIINSSGTTVVHKIAEAEKGIRNIQIDGSSELQPGMYMLEVIVNSKERMLVKLIKE